MPVVAGRLVYNETDNLQHAQQYLFVNITLCVIHYIVVFISVRKQRNMT